jgi:hypothetical protein
MQTKFKFDSWQLKDDLGLIEEPACRKKFGPDRSDPVSAP